MKNSRKDGILILNCHKPYKMAIDGQYVEKYRLLCKEHNSESEYAVMDLGQYLTVALMNMPQNEQIQTDKTTDEQEKKAMKFYDNECPTMAEVEEQATLIEMMMLTNNQVTVSKLMQCFEGIVRSGLIFMEGNVQMPYQTWKQIHINDKLKIMYSYIAFFVNPLQRLVSLSTRMGSLNGMQGETVKTSKQ